MKKIAIYFFVLILSGSVAFAFEEVSLNADEVNRLKVPTSLALEQEREHRENYLKQSEDDYFEPEDNVFESKTGKTLNKFVDNVIINNKINRKLTQYENMFLDDEK